MRRILPGVFIALAVCGAALAQGGGSASTVTFKVPMDKGGFSLRIRAGGAAPHQVQVDTGSTGIVVGYPHVGGNPPQLTPAQMAQYGLSKNYILYNSSGNVAVGKWVLTSVEISDRSGNSVMVDRIPVLSVDHMCQIGRGETVPPASCLNAPAWKVDCTQPRSKWALQTTQLCDLGMMGVGFDRGASMGNSGANPFLQARQMVAGTMQRGYIVSAANGITLGPTAANTRGFRFIPLTKIDPAKPYDWQQASGCVTATGGGITNPGPPVCGEVLMDTGVDRMFLTYASGFPAFTPPVTDPATGVDLWNCPLTQTPPRPCTIYGRARSAAVVVSWPSAANPVFQYSPSAPARFVSNGTAPANVHMRSVPQLSDPGEKVFVNTSRQLLYLADYLYDASSGRIGFRPLPPRGGN